MNDHAPLRRCAAVWLTATAAALACAALAAPAAVHPVGSDFAGLLVRGCAFALLASLAWLWLGATVLLAGVARGHAAPPGRGLLPRAVRRSLLAACGVAVLTAGPVAAEPGSAPVPRPGAAASVVSGLPLPVRPIGGLSTTAWATRVAAAVAESPAAPASGSDHVVRPGESLWSIAAAALPPGSSPADVDASWRRIHAANRDVIGADPHLIHPGQRLTLPPA